MIKSYSEAMAFNTFQERFEYLKLGSAVAKDTFGSMRYLNQALYNSNPWRALRNRLIVRDNGFDMAVEGHPIKKCVLHHINPITIEDFENDSSIIWDPENLICVDFNTHQAIHYGSFNLIKTADYLERSPNDTKLW